MVKYNKLLMGSFIVLLCLSLAANSQDMPQRGQSGASRAAGRGMAMARGGRGGRVTSPEIHDDNRVTFRLSAPDATSVSVSGDQGAMRAASEMTKDENGVWSVTVGPLDSEMYGYTFTVDGARVWDPSNMQLKRDGSRITSVLIVPGGNGDLYSIKTDVPHGTLSKVWYESKTLNLTQRRVYVYTPPGYETSDDRYPVFYLLHGGGGDEDAWTSLGRTPQIFDNMIAQGKVKPMIVVMTNGNSNQIASQDIVPSPPRTAMGRGAQPAGERGAAARGQAGAGRGAAARGEAGGRAARGGTMSMMSGASFPESIVQDVIPFIEKSYRTLTGQANRAIAGLSMGGMHTSAVTLAHPDVFSYYGLMSGGTYTPEQLADHKANLKLVFLSCGESESVERTNTAATAPPGTAN